MCLQRSELGIVIPVSGFTPWRPFPIYVTYPSGYLDVGFIILTPVTASFSPFRPRPPVKAMPVVLPLRFTTLVAEAPSGIAIDGPFACPKKDGVLVAVLTSGTTEVADEPPKIVPPATPSPRRVPVLLADP